MNSFETEPNFAFPLNEIATKTLIHHPWIVRGVQWQVGNFQTQVEKAERSFPFINFPRPPGSEDLFEFSHGIKESTVRSGSTQQSILISCWQAETFAYLLSPSEIGLQAAAQMILDKQEYLYKYLTGKDINNSELPLRYFLDVQFSRALKTLEGSQDTLRRAEVYIGIRDASTVKKSNSNQKKIERYRSLHEKLRAQNPSEPLGRRL